MMPGVFVRNISVAEFEIFSNKEEEGQEDSKNCSLNSNNAEGFDTARSG